MKPSILFLFMIVLAFVGLSPTAPAQSTTSKTIDLLWVTYRSGSAVDSVTKGMDKGGTDSTQIVAIPDSSSDGGGVYVNVFANEDSTQAIIKAIWYVYDFNAKIYRPWLATATTLDSLVSGNHTGALKNPVGATLHFRRPRGATHVQFSVATVDAGQWPSNAGVKTIPRVDAQLIVPRL